MREHRDGWDETIQDQSIGRETHPVDHIVPWGEWCDIEDNVIWERIQESKDAWQVMRIGEGRITQCPFGLSYKHRTYLKR